MIGFESRGAVCPSRIASWKRLAVAVVGQLAPELVDEQAAVREDQDALGAGGLDEAGGGDRLARGGRVAEAVAADRAGILRDRQRLRLVSSSSSSGASSSSSSSSSSSGGRLVTVAVPVLGRLLRRGDQLGEHAGERVDLVAAQLGAGGEVRRLLREDALEAEQERVAHLPGRATAPSARRRSRRGRRRAPGVLRCPVRERPPGRRRHVGTARRPRLLRGGRRP